MDIPQLAVIDLSRNFGHHHAAQAGLRHARGDLVFLIDCDLEVRPHVLVKFYRKLRQADCDVVFGCQEVRKRRSIRADQWKSILERVRFSQRRQDSGKYRDGAHNDPSLC